MNIKEIDPSEFYQRKKDSKSILFKEGIQKILDNRIEFCELTDYPYSFATSVNDIVGQAHCVLGKEFRKITGKRIDKNCIPFKMRKIKDSNNNYHIYCHFDVQTWDELIRKENPVEEIQSIEME